MSIRKAIIRAADSAAMEVAKEVALTAGREAAIRYVRHSTRKRGMDSEPTHGGPEDVEP